MSYDVVDRPIPYGLAEGPVSLGLSAENGRVGLHYSAPVEHIDMEPNQALALAKKLQIYARKARRGEPC